MGFKIKDAMISYFSYQDNVFVFAGRDPIGQSTTIPLDDLDLNKKLIIRCRPHFESPQRNE
jgi:hypothetical protein